MLLRVVSLALLFVLSGVVGASADTESKQIAAVRAIIEAVNTNDADLYVSVYAPEAFIRRFEGAVLLEGREALRANRRAHFERFPKSWSEIQHLVEIEDIVVMHDRVWLNGKDGPSADLVEIYKFEDGLIVSVDLIQRETLLDEADQ